MDLTVSRCFVQVDDPDRALAFYRDALGLEVRNDVARESFRWITVGSGSQPGVEIVRQLRQRARRLDVTRASLEELLISGELDDVRVVVETLSTEHDIMDIALAAVKLAHQANDGATTDETEIPVPTLFPP